MVAAVAAQRPTGSAEHVAAGAQLWSGWGQHRGPGLLVGPSQRIAGCQGWAEAARCLRSKTMPRQRLAWCNSSQQPKDATCRQTAALTMVNDGPAVRHPAVRGRPAVRRRREALLLQLWQVGRLRGRQRVGGGDGSCWRAGLLSKASPLLQLLLMGCPLLLFVRGAALDFGLFLLAADAAPADAADDGRACSAAQTAANNGANCKWQKEVKERRSKQMIQCGSLLSNMRSVPQARQRCKLQQGQDCPTVTRLSWLAGSARSR